MSPNVLPIEQEIDYIIYIHFSAWFFLAYLSFKEIIEIIKKSAFKGTSNYSDVLSMPLQQRNFEVAMSSVNETIYSNIAVRDGKSNYWCIVSGGAPGIGIVSLYFS